MNFKTPHLTALLFVSALGIYYPVLFAPFNSLDDLLLVHQLLNTDSFSLKSHFFPGGVSSYYRPVLTLTFIVDKYVWGLHESFMHLENMLLHAVNVLLVFCLARLYGKMINRDSAALSFLAALLFAVHPINTEAVNWISARADVLAGTFVFGSLVAALLAFQNKKMIWRWVAAFSLLLGLLCKETAIFLLPGLFSIVLWNARQHYPVWRGQWAVLSVSALAVVCYFPLRLLAFKQDLGIGHTSKFVSQVVSVSPDEAAAKTSVGLESLSQLITEGVAVVLKSIGFYTVKLLQPFPLSFAIDRVSLPHLFAGFLVIFLLVWYRRRPVWPIFMVAFLLGTSALLVVFTRLAWTPIAERYMYIPSGPFLVGIVYWGGGLAEKHGKQNLAVIGILIILGIFTWGTYSRNILWQDNLTLYQDTLAKAPDAALVKNELAVALISHGREQEAYELLATIAVPDAQYASLNKALAYARQDDYAGARELLLERLENPGLLEFRIIELLISLTYEQIEKTSDEQLKQRYYRDILSWLERVDKKTHNAFNYYRMGRLNLLLGDRASAQRCFAEAARKLPEGSPFKAPAQKLAQNLVP